MDLSRVRFPGTAPQKTTFHYHPHYESSSHHSPKLHTNPSQRLRKRPMVPSDYINGGFRHMHLQEIISSQWTSLEQACIQAKVNRKSKKSTPAAATADATPAISDEEITLQWMDELLQSSNYFQHIELRADKEIPVYKEKRLQSYFISPSSRSDVWVGTKDAPHYPLAQLELLSKDDVDHTVGECERALINQLRFYANYDTNITEVIGFVLPASKLKDSSKDSSKAKITERIRRNKHRACPIMKVTMTWNDEEFQFESRLSVLKDTRSFLQEFCECIESSLDTVQHFNDFSNFFVPVRPSALENIFGPGAIQLPSGKSIVVAHNDHVYKLPFSSENAISTLAEIYKFKKSTTGDRHFISLPDTTLSYGLFFKFDRLVYPLTKDQAFLCCCDFLEKTAIAMKALHGCNYGHFDIRLENCCFRYTESVEVVLIDLDTMSGLTTAPSILGASSMGVMPKNGNSNGYSVLDWKQFGLMGCYILEDKPVTNREYQNSDYIFSAYNKFDFFKSLIDLGEYDGEKLKIMCTTLETKTVYAILNF